MGTDKQRYQVTADVARNRLDINLRGSITKNDIDHIYTDIRFGVADLEQGFGVVTDLTDAHIGHLIGIATFKKIARFLQNSGVGRVIRVSPNPSIIATQLARLSSMVQNYETTYVKTREEAEALLTAQPLYDTQDG